MYRDSVYWDIYNGVITDSDVRKSFAYEDIVDRLYILNQIEHLIDTNTKQGFRCVFFRFSPTLPVGKHKTVVRLPETQYGNPALQINALTTNAR